MSKNKDRVTQMELIPASKAKQQPYVPVKSQFDSPRRQDGVIDLLMSENSFFTLSKKEIEDFDYESPDGKFSLKARVMDKTIGLPTLGDSLILHYIGAVMRDKRLDNGEPPKHFDIQAKQFFDFCGKAAGGQAYIDFMKAIRRLSSTEYEISRYIDPREIGVDQAPEYEEGDLLKVVESDRLIKSHKRLEIEKKSGRTVVTAVRIEICDWLRESLFDKRKSLVMDRDLYLIATPILMMTAYIVRKQMGDKSTHTISYEKLRHRCRSKQSTAEFKRTFKSQVKKYGIVGFDVDVGPPRATNVTFYRSGNQGVLEFVKDLSKGSE